MIAQVMWNVWCFFSFFFNLWTDTFYLKTEQNPFLPLNIMKHTCMFMWKHHYKQYMIMQHNNVRYWFTINHTLLQDQHNDWTPFAFPDVTQSTYKQKMSIIKSDSSTAWYGPKKANCGHFDRYCDCNMIYN